MPDSGEILVTLPGQRRIDATVRGHTVHTDQPTTNGGEDTAPSPFELFLASLGTCAGIFVQGFCAKRGIPFERIQLTLRHESGADGVLSRVELRIRVPVDFPENYRDALVRVAEQCSVKRAIEAKPVFHTSVEVGA